MSLPGENIASHLQVMARRQPYTLAVVFPEGRDRRERVSYTHYTYRQLDDASDWIAHGLEAVGIRRGVRTVLMVKPSLEFFALTFALFKVGAVPVLVDPGMGIRNLGRCLDDARPEAFIGIAKAHAARLLLGWAKNTLRIVVSVGRGIFRQGRRLEDLQTMGQAQGRYDIPPTQADETAAILFTSGSTGPPKGAVYTHSVFTAQVEMLQRSYGIQPGEIDLCTFPLFALFAPALGMTAVIPDMDASRPAEADPRRIIEAIENFGVTTMFGSPALLNRVGQFGAAHSVRLPSLRRVISAGAPVAAAVIESLTRMLSPGVQVFTPYGATEALPVTSIGSDELLKETRTRTAEGAGVCVGRPVEPVQVRIIRIMDEPIASWSDDLLVPAGQIGEIVVTGPIVTREYCNHPDADALAKIADPQRGRFHHRMGDVGYLDEKGRLWFCGRKSHRVRTANGTLFTIPCEAIFNVHPHVSRTALVGVGEAGGQKPVLCVETRSPHPSPLSPGGRGVGGEGIDRNAFIKELLVLGSGWPHTRAIDTILVHPKFPVDIRHNAKIQREKLAEWAERKLK